MDGSFSAMNLMISMLPEELLLEKAMEALQVYKLTSGEPPRAEIFALMQKWASLGMSPREVLAKSKEAEDIYKVGKQMTNLGDAQN